MSLDYIEISRQDFHVLDGIIETLLEELKKNRNGIDYQSLCDQIDSHMYVYYKKFRDQQENSKNITHDAFNNLIESVFHDELFEEYFN